jgi:hypothetical protein
VVRQFGPRVISDVDMDPGFRWRVLEGLSGVTAEETGTAYQAFNSLATGGADFPLERYPVAGKTGTAEVRGKADTSLFAAFGPVREPTFAIVAILEEAGFGSSVAAPLVARIMEKVAEETVPDAPLASVRYARSTALPLCLKWYEWRSGNTLDRLEAADPSALDTGGPSLDASGTVRVRGIRVDCESLLDDVMALFGNGVGAGADG